MELALEIIAKKYGASCKVGRITYGESATVKIEFAKKSSNKNGEVVLDKAAREFIKRATGMSMRPDVLNEKMSYNGDTVIITGYNTRARAYPINYTVNGKGYKASVNYIQRIVKEVKPHWFL